MGLGKIFGIGGDNGAEGIRREALAAIDAVRVPTIEEQKIELQKLVQQGVITPEEAQVYLQSRTEFDNIDIDPTTRAAMMEALLGLQDAAEGDGTKFQRKAATQEIIDELETANRGSNQAIMQNMAERGMGGSGFELANKLASSQSASERASKRGTDLAAAAEAQALEALMKSGDLAGNIRGMDYEQAARKAAAQDAINAFNTANRNTVTGQNVDRRNQAQYVNLGEKQRVSDTNTLMENENRAREADLIQRRYDNSLNKAAAKAGQLNDIAGGREDRARRDDQFTGGVISTIGQMGASYYGGKAGAASDKRVKIEIEGGDVDVDEFMDNLKPKKFRYENPNIPGAAPGKRLGVMAQDLEKSPTGRSLVINTPTGKRIDSDQAINAILAALGELNEKVEEEV